MSIVISWDSQNIYDKAKGGVRKTMELPDDSWDIHLESSSWTSDGIFVWYKDKFGSDKCKKLVSTKYSYGSTHEAIANWINFKIEPATKTDTTITNR